ncbi:MAG: penicillin-binding protein [Frankiales bacterium]|jgi:peptidoglycan glycosyltransferase|nr:penicillin-binding protein [Frankiales bacterium]
MNPPLRRVAMALLLMFGALFANATWLQVVNAGDLRTKQGNTRVLLNQYEHQRGPIVAGNVIVARSVATKDRLKYLRVYPQGEEYAPITGYYSVTLGFSGIERQENSILSGSDDRLFVRRLSDLVTGRTPRGGTVKLTVNPKAQDAAWDGLQGKVGAVVALDPRTGAVLAMASNPSYDPNTLSSHNARAVTTASTRLNTDRRKPRLNRAIEETYPPGSTFKVVTAAAALESGKYTPDTVIPAPTQLSLPQTNRKLKNFGGEVCSGSGKMPLKDALRISCNTAFAALGLRLGADALQATAERFGFGRAPLELDRAAASVFPSNLNPPQTAQSAIGQFDVRVTPMQMALVAAGVANNGVVMKPYLVKELQGPDLAPLSLTEPKVLSRAMDAPAASALTSMMVNVVNNGTGTAARISGVTVAGKTGTAQHAAGAAPHAWFIAFAPAQNPVVAVAVLIEDGGNLNREATGGRVAAPIARAVIEAVLGR